MTRAVGAFKDPDTRPMAFFVGCVVVSLLSLLGSSLVTNGTAQVSQEISRPR